MNDLTKDSQGDVVLARSAALGNNLAREKVSQLAKKLIMKKNRQLCKEYCYGNRLSYRCTIDSQWGGQGGDAPLCDKENDGYLWMLQDLTGVNRLLKYEGRNGATLLDYWSSIAASHSFVERWKDWRFRRRIRVPSYIHVIDDDAGRLFRWMVDGDDAANMAQRLNRDEAEVVCIVGKIVDELGQRNRLHLLERPKEISLTGFRQQVDSEGENGGGEWEVPVADVSVDEQEVQAILWSAWNELESVEQFVLEAMVIDGLSAKMTLQALRDEGVSLKLGVSPEDLKLQDVYYFCRKTLSKLKKLTGLDSEDMNELNKPGIDQRNI